MADLQTLDCMLERKSIKYMCNKKKGARQRFDEVLPYIYIFNIEKTTGTARLLVTL